MPQPRKPTNILHLNGSAKKHPDRMKKRGNEPTDTRTIGRCPPGLTREEKRAWRELVACDPGVLCKSDRSAVELAARLMAQVRTGESTSAQMALLSNLLNKFGQTPHGRNYVQVPEPKELNPFDAD